MTARCCHGVFLEIEGNERVSYRVVTPKSHIFCLFTGFLVLYVQRRLCQNFFGEPFYIKRLDLHSIYLLRANFIGETLPIFLESIYGCTPIHKNSRFSLFEWFFSQFCKGDSAKFLSKVDSFYLVFFMAIKGI